MPEITVLKNKNKEKYQIPKGTNLLKFLSDKNYELNTYCGGKGLCGKCKIKINSNSIPLNPEEKKLLSDQEINEGIRLACLTKIDHDIEVELQNMSDIIALTSGLMPKIDFDLLIDQKSIILEKPELEDQRDILQRIYDKTNTDNINIRSLIILNNLDKEKPLTITFIDNKIIDIKQGEREKEFYGLAVDIGTTTIVIYLIDLYNKTTIDNISLYNPQKKFGADVISRINYSIDEKDGSRQLKQELITGLNQGIKNLLKNNNIKNDNVYHTTVVGNTVMIHTLLGLETESISKSPYIPLFTDKLDLSPDECGLNLNQGGIVQILPSISGYIGADIMGDMLAIDINNNFKNTSTIDLMVDIGTNGELVLSTEKEIYTCSTAAGPAFEGANIAFGMAGIPGAISEFKFNSEGDISYKTIKNEKAKGICGSGLLDIVAQLYKNDLIDQNGSFVNKNDMSEKHQKIMTEYNNLKAFKIVNKEESADNNDILITQKDIREVQLAKGAIQAGIKILKKEVGIEYDDIDNIYIAGGFGNYLDPHHACTINLIPEELENKIIQIGNGAGAGAQLFIFDKKTQNYVKAIKEKVKYIELSSRQDFQNEFMGSMQF